MHDRCETELGVCCVVCLGWYWIIVELLGRIFFLRDCKIK